MAAQIAIRLLMENPYATPQELPIKFLVLINSAVPPLIMPLDGQEVTYIPIEEAPKLQMLFDVFKANPADHLDKIRPATLANGRQVRYGDQVDGFLLSEGLKRTQKVSNKRLINLPPSTTTGPGQQDALHDVFRQRLGRQPALHALAPHHGAGRRPRVRPAAVRDCRAGPSGADRPRVWARLSQGARHEQDHRKGHQGHGGEGFVMAVGNGMNSYLSWVMCSGECDLLLQPASVKKLIVCLHSTPRKTKIVPMHLRCSYFISNLSPTAQTRQPSHQHHRPSNSPSPRVSRTTHSTLPRQAEWW